MMFLNGEDVFFRVGILKRCGSYVAFLLYNFCMVRDGPIIFYRGGGGGGGTIFGTCSQFF